MPEKSSKNIDFMIKFLWLVVALLIVSIVGSIIYGVVQPNDFNPGWQFRMALALCFPLVGCVIALILNIKARKR